MLNNFYKKSLAPQKLQFFRKTLQESLLTYWDDLAPFLIWVMVRSTPLGPVPLWIKEFLRDGFQIDQLQIKKNSYMSIFKHVKIISYPKALSIFYRFLM